MSLRYQTDADIEAEAAAEAAAAEGGPRERRVRERPEPGGAHAARNAENQTNSSINISVIMYSNIGRADTV